MTDELEDEAADEEAEPPAPSSSVPSPDEVGATRRVTTEGTTAMAGGAATELTKFLWRTPFLDLHERAKDPHLHPTREHVCFVIDVTFRVLAALLLLALIAAVGWKTLSPFPDPL